MTTITETSGSSVEAAPGSGAPVGGTLPPPVPVLVIVVHGVPAPQGSKRHVGHGVMVESSKKVKPWRQDVVAAALTASEDAAVHDDVPFDGPLAARMVFTFARPQSHYRTGRNARLLRDGAPCQPCSAPDLSKLARSTEDALTTAGIWRDDSRVVEYDRLAKVWADSDPEALSTPGARIEVRRVGR
jgi:Holliday junction resolvase RusA-like endonuclease